MFWYLSDTLYESVFHAYMQARDSCYSNTLLVTEKYCASIYRISTIIEIVSLTNSAYSQHTEIIKDVTNICEYVNLHL